VEGARGDQTRGCYAGWRHTVTSARRCNDAGPRGVYAVKGGELGGGSSCEGSPVMVRSVCMGCDGCMG